MARTPLIVVGPVPPPVHGVAVSTSLVLANPFLGHRFDVEHLDTSDHRPNLDNIGRWDVTNVFLALAHLTTLLRRLRGRSGLVYLPLSQNTAAFLRDSLFIALSTLFGWRVAAHLRGSAFPEFYAGRGTPLRAWIRFSLARLASVAVMGSSLRHVFDGIVPPEKIEVVPNGTPDLEPDSTHRDPNTVVFLSNLLRPKGVVESVEAALRVLARHPTARFLFVGSWEDDELERILRARTAGSGGRIQFLPSVSGEAKRTLLLSSSVLLFPPVRPEGHPRVILEAASAGLPVVTTDRGAIAETVADGETGFVLDDPVPEKLADRLLHLLGDPALRERMGEAARARYLALFTQEQADQRLADWLARVAA